MALLVTAPFLGHLAPYCPWNKRINGTMRFACWWLRLILIVSELQYSLGPFIEILWTESFRSSTTGGVYHSRLHDFVKHFKVGTGRFMISTSQVFTGDASLVVVNAKDQIIAFAMTMILGVDVMSFHDAGTSGFHRVVADRKHNMFVCRKEAGLSLGRQSYPSSSRSMV